MICSLVTGNHISREHIATILAHPGYYDKMIHAYHLVIAQPGWFVCFQCIKETTDKTLAIHMAKSGVTTIEALDSCKGVCIWLCVHCLNSNKNVKYNRADQRVHNIVEIIDSPFPNAHPSNWCSTCSLTLTATMWANNSEFAETANEDTLMDETSTSGMTAVMSMI